MSNRPRAVKAHRVRKGITTHLLKGGKHGRKVVERIFERHNLAYGIKGGDGK